MRSKKPVFLAFYSTEHTVLLNNKPDQGPLIQKPSGSIRSIKNGLPTKYKKFKSS